MKEITSKDFMTTKEIADCLGTTKDVVLANAKKCLPNKVIEHGKKTFWDKAEVTVLIDYMQNHKSNNRSVELNSTVENTSTDLTPALMIKQAMELAQKGYELELKRIEAEKNRILKQRDNLLIELDEAKDWFSIKRMQKLNPNVVFKYSVLKKESKKLGYDVKKVFDANYGEVNAYHKDVYESLYFDTLDFGD